MSVRDRRKGEGVPPTTQSLTWVQFLRHGPNGSAANADSTVSPYTGCPPARAAAIRRAAPADMTCTM